MAINGIYKRPFFWVLAAGLVFGAGLRAGSVAFAQIDSPLGSLSEGAYQAITAAAGQALGEKKLSAEGLELLREMIEPVAADRSQIFLPLPLRARRSDMLRVELPANVRSLLEVSAADLVAQAKRLNSQGAAARAYRLLFQALALDPRQKDALKILDASLESLAQRKITSQVNQPYALIGWPAKSYSGIVTPHFKIASQAPQRISDELASFCEQTYCVWQQLFFDYWCEPMKLTDRLQGKNTPLEANHEFNIVLFRDRADYQQALSTAEANIGISTGYYSPKMKVAFFYFDSDKSWPTIAHELTHQFFQEAGRLPSRLDTDAQSDFWVVEAIAMYMESITRRNGIDCKVVEVGGWDAPRLQAARYRRINDEFWIPWDELQRATGKSFRQGKDVALWYSQCAGLAHFWMDSDEQRRQSLAKYLTAVYQQQPTAKILSETVNDTTLRDQYDRFIVPTKAQIASRKFAVERQDFVLNRTAVDTETLLSWKTPMRHCHWLDVSFTKVDDQLFLKSSENPWDCVRLSLEGTRVTDASLRTIAAMPRLEELDLSNCAISDDGFKELQRHRTLKILWLTGTAVTDAALPIIESLPNLVSVDIQGTKITPQEWQKSLRKLPRLKK